MEKKIAKDLLSIGAVFLRPEQPFTWASGIKSPIYCDNRLTLTAPVVRGHVEAGLAEIVRTKFPEAEVLMGPRPPESPMRPSRPRPPTCRWAMCAAARRTTAAATGSRAGSKRARRSS